MSKGSTRNRLSQHSNIWWTRERVIRGMLRFYEHFGFAPTSTAAWQDKQQFTGGQRRDGHTSNRGSDQLYPSSYAILKYWRSYRDAWADCGIELDQADRPWSLEEEWFITESTGLISRDEVARFLGRTGPAIKRRLYELGVGAYSKNGRWGWTLHHVERLLGIAQHVIKKYLEEGHIPYLQGCKCIYIDPADLLLIKEYDWTRPDIPSEAVEAIRKSLMKRLCFAVLRFDWRAHSPYKIQKTCERYVGRIRNRRLLNYVPDRPKDIGNFNPGDWVKVLREKGSTELLVPAIGRISSIYWSSQKTAPHSAPCWMARVEFKQKYFLYCQTKGNTWRPRFHYTVRLDQLEAADDPTIKRELSQEAEAVYSRLVKNPRRTARLRKRGAQLLAGEGVQ